MVAEAGVESVTLRALGRRVGVSHSAPLHHFGSRGGLLEALSAEGFEALLEELDGSPADPASQCAAFVLWALAHPAHYAVMWAPEVDAGQGPAALHGRFASAVGGDPAAAQTAFALAHGLAELWISGALPRPERAGDAVWLLCEQAGIG